MVWFQCEDCGDNLKKPKLPNHFRVCSAYKLSCIDCGQMFSQQDVESHTQCITEAEKYGPKGQVKPSNGVNTKPKNDTKQKPEVDINVGLSNRPPWFCSLCNTQATSKQTLLLHADGKKHRAKARAFHAAKQQPNAETTNGAKSEVPKDTDLGESRDQNSSKVSAPHNESGPETNALKSDKKRKLEASESNGEVVQINGSEIKVTESLKKPKNTQEDAKLDPTLGNGLGVKKIKWKKLITSTLKSNQDGVLKFKKLKKLVVKSLKESGYTEDKNLVSEMLEKKINSSSKFIVDGKYVRLATSS